MITKYDLAAAHVYTQAWTTDEDQWTFDLLPATVDAEPGQSISGPARPGPALSVRAYGQDRGNARYGRTRCALVRVGSLTCSVQDRAAADTMRDTGGTSPAGPVVLGRQANTPRR